MKVFGEDHKQTLNTLNNLGVFYKNLKNYEKALGYFESAFEGYEKILGMNHPDTVGAVMSMAVVYTRLKDFRKVEELFPRALEGLEAQLGKDDVKTKQCALNFRWCLELSGNSDRLIQLIASHPWLIE